MTEELRHHLAEFHIVIHQEDGWLFAIAIHECAPHRTVKTASQGADATAFRPATLIVSRQHEEGWKCCASPM